MYIEFAPFIFFTLLIFVHMIILSIKLIGPVPETYKENEKSAKAYGVSYFGMLSAVAVVFLMVVSIITETQKPYFSAVYFINANRLFFYLTGFAISIWMVIECLLFISKWHIIIYSAVIGCLAGYWSYLSLATVLSGEEFLLTVIVSLFLVGITGWIFLILGLKKLNKQRGKFTAPLFIPSEKTVKIIAGKNTEVLLFLIIIALFFLSWADIPIF